ncbi:glycosyltransferase [Gelidibacter pelagius]|uniref:Glycosyltransferase n=1 Tax=Gelidibacter pelagius TaxID=2819985 RepID=A0ABS3SWT6_9FLAO|nr:glycosyltransferase [Gelidibacter pelagius]MBO3099916.1 glycosyltransferase [Gelidibacter pelagius]
MKIAFITNKPYEDCETFIKAQVDGLPFKMLHYWGRKIPFNIEATKPSILFLGFRKLGLIKKKSNLNRFVEDLHLKNIQLIFAQYGMMGEEVLKACKILNLPLVVHFHGHDAVRKSVLEHYENYKKLFSYERLTIVSVSKEMTKRLIAIGCPENKIAYNVYGPANNYLSLLPKYSQKQFISIGRFVDKKAPHLTILAFNDVLKIHNDVVLIYAGDGVLLDSCKDLVEALGISKKVKFPGRITPNEYQDYLAESLAYVQHSIEAQDGDMEGTPVSILEASAAGLPVISTIHAGIPDVILHEETGLLSQERDIIAMTKHLLWVLENPQESQIMGMRGKERIENNYTMSHHLNNLSKIIKIAKTKE